MSSEPHGPVESADVQRVEVGVFVIERRGDDVRVVHPDVPSPLLASAPGAPLVSAARGEARVSESRGFFRVRERRGAWDEAASLGELRSEGDGAALAGTLRGGGAWTLRFEALDAARLRWTLSLDDPGFNRARLCFASDPDERFFGFGNQFTELEMKGRRVPVLSQEPGIGRGVQPLTWFMETFFKAGGSWSHSNAPAPQCVTSRRRGLILDVHAYAEFDLTAPDRVELSAHTAALAGELHGAATPLALIEAATATTGRMPALPDWIHTGAVLGFQGGRDAALAFLAKVEGAGASVAALWLQDWVGARKTSIGQQLWWNWESDPARYPDWPAFVAELRARGVRVMSYLNPFLVDPQAKGSFTRNFYAEAKQRGFLVCDHRDEPYAIQNTSFAAGLLDLTHPEARAWLKELITTQYLDPGVSGWMADFGEALPFDAQLHAGDAAEFHNQYPEVWAQLNREACDAHPAGADAVFFTRSGFLRSPGHTRLQWLGDQLTSWSREDGIHSAVVGLLSSGFSGYAFNHSDVGGYTATNIPWLPFRTPLVGHERSRELLWRWIELNAFTAVFRTHEGNQPTRHAQVDHDPETLAHFARFARVYAALGDYRRELGVEAEARGLPLVRHTWLHAPDDPAALELEQQFLLGPDLLVAPVLTRGALAARAYLPAGRWRHLWTDAAAGDPARGGWVRVNAPLGAPAVFHREGSTVGQALRETLAAQGDLVDVPAPVVVPETEAPPGRATPALGPALLGLLPKLAVGLAVVFLVALGLRHFFGEPLQAAGAWLVAELGLVGLFAFTLGIDSVPTPLSYFPLLLLGIEGGLDPGVVLAVASAASVLAGWLGYAVGRLVGMPPRVEAWLRANHPQTPDLLQRYGAWGIVLIGGLPLPFALGTWSAGAMGVGARHAMLASLVRIPKTALYVLFIVLGVQVGAG